MLERAKVCLKAGARDSLKCAQAHVPQSSRRLLHSTFWTHGAGDLSPPPWATFSTSIHDDPPLQQHSRHSAVGSKRLEAQNTATASPEGVFLDFLYPPQALAWIHKANSQHLERWEKRNARRLPEGFIQASRRYSSRPYTRSSSDLEPAEQGEEEEVSREARDSLTLESGKNDTNFVSSSNRDTGRVTIRATQALKDIDPSPGSREREGQLYRPFFSAKKQSSNGPAVPDRMLGHFSGELSEVAAEEPLPDDPYHALCKILGRRRHLQGQDTASEVWRLYTSLTEAEKQELRLKSELLVWLGAQANPIADAHCISLYWSLAPGERDLSTYRVALAAFLRRNDFKSATALHQEALENIPNGPQISNYFFDLCFQNRQWERAFEVQNQHHEYFSAAGQTQQKALFWLHVSEMPNLWSNTCRLLFICLLQRKLKRWQLLLPFAARLSVEVLNQRTGTPFLPQETSPALKNQSAVRLLGWAIGTFNPNGVQVLESMIMSLLQRNEHKSQWAKAILIASPLYRHFRTMTDVRPSEEMLSLFLRRLTRYWDNSEDIESGSSGQMTLTEIIDDWIKHFGRLNPAAIVDLLGFYAKLGLSEDVTTWYDYLQRHYSSYEQQKPGLWTLVYVHARRADLPKAIEAFTNVQQLATANKDHLEPKVWNILLHAYSRADDIDGALATFKNFLDDGQTPNDYTVHPIAEMFARRGDVAAVDNLLEQYDHLSKEPRRTSLVAARLGALVKCGDLAKAESCLGSLGRDVFSRKVLGSLTKPFNLVINAYALRRDIDSTMRLYRWMKTMKIRVDEFTFSAVMQVFIHYSVTSVAEKMMMKLMVRDGHEPSALHFAIVMTGYVNQQLPEEALRVHEIMRSRNIRPTAASNKAFLKAKAVAEHMSDVPYADRQLDPEHVARPLEGAMEALRQILARRDGSEKALKQPGFGHDKLTSATTASQYISSIMYIHGNRICRDAVEELFSLYGATAQEHGQGSIPPMQLLAAFMSALVNAGQYDKVETWWKLAKTEADRLAPSTPLVDFRRPQSSDPVELDAQAESPGTPAADNSLRSGKGLALDKRGEVADIQTSPPPQGARILRPAPARRHVLTRPIIYYMRALAEQGKTTELVRTCTQVLNQGYTFDRITWNRFVEYLCRATPPLALLAFTLTERFMMSDWPGWMTYTRRVYREARMARLQYMRAHHLPPNLIIPQYQTLLHLTSALNWLRRTEAMKGEHMHGDAYLDRLVGSEQEIRESAPRTLAALESMPTIDDHWQNSILGRTVDD